MFEWMNAPEQKVWATLLDKGQYRSGKYSHNYAIFEFADGTRYTFEDILHSTHKSLKENTRGVVVYTVTDENIFFERFVHTGEQKNLPPVTNPLPTNASLYEIDGDDIDDDADAEQIVKHNNRVFIFLGLFLGLFYATVLVYSALTSPILFIFFVLIALLYVYSLIKTKVDKNKFEAVSEQQRKATLAGKEPGNRILFLFEDETTKKMEVPVYVYKTLVKGDAGLLTFKEIKKNILYIDFVRQ